MVRVLDGDGDRGDGDGEGGGDATTSANVRGKWVRTDEDGAMGPTNRKTDMWAGNGPRTGRKPYAALYRWAVCRHLGKVMWPPGINFLARANTASVAGLSMYSHAMRPARTAGEIIYPMNPMAEFARIPSCSL